MHLKILLDVTKHPYLLAGRTPVPQTSQQESLMIALFKCVIKIDCVKIPETFKCIFSKFYFVPTR